MNFYQGVITQPNATTGDQTITGVGFTPKFVLFFSAAKTADADNAGDLVASIGATDGTNDCVASFMRPDNTSGATNGVGHDDANVIKFHDNGNPPTVAAAASFVSFNSDGFVINWGTCDATQRLIGFIAIGGTDLTNVKIGTFTTADATGEQAFTGVGFQPDLLMILGAGDTSSAFPALARQNGGMRVGGGTNTIFDDFDRADSDSLGSDWSEVSGDIDIVSNKASSANAARALWVGAWPGKGANYHMQATFNLGGSVGGVELIARYADSSNFYSVHMNTFSQTIYLRKKVAGSDTDIASFNGGYSNGNDYVVRWEINGTSHKVYVDGTERINTTDGDLDDRGSVGIGMDSSSKTVDNFWVYSQFGYANHAYSGDNPTNSDDVYKRTKILTVHDNGVYGEAALQTLDSDGFTLNFNDGHAGKFFYIALKGPKIGFQNFTEKASTGAQTTAGVGFTPKGMLHFGNIEPAREGTVNGNHQLIIGASDGTRSATASWNSGGAQSGTSRDRGWWDDDDVYRSGIFFSSPLCVADFTSFDSANGGGWTWNYATAGDAGRDIQAIAFGDGDAPASEDRTTGMIADDEMIPYTRTF